MTPEQYTALMNAILAIGKKVDPATNWNSFLVGDGVVRPTAPTQLEAASNPGQWAGTQYDPLNIDNIHVRVVELFETIPQAFIGGKFYDWFKQDQWAAMAYYKHRYHVPLEFSKLAPSQRALLGLPPA